MNESPLLSLVDVHKSFPVTPAETTSVLRGVNLNLEAGETAAVIGPSGSGKSTLLNIMGALDRPTSGKVTLDGSDLSGLDDVRLSRVRNQKIGFIFQLHHLLPQSTVLENVLIPVLAAQKSTHDVTESKAKALLDRVGLSHRLDYRPGQLSGGERQRVAVVRALINDPVLILADEPTGSLDEQASEKLIDLLVELNREKGAAMVMVTHALDLAKKMGSVYRIQDGALSREARR